MLNTNARSGDATMGEMKNQLSKLALLAQNFALFGYYSAKF